MADEDPPSTPANPSDLLPTTVKTWASKVVGSPWMNAVTGGFLLTVVAAGAAYLVTPSLYGPSIPYDDSSVGEIARYTIKADRDYDIPDEATTQRQKDDSAAQVKPVYDYDLSVAQGALSRVRSGFSRMQEAVAAARAKLPAPVPGDTSSAPSKHPQTKSNAKKGDSPSSSTTASGTNTATATTTATTAPSTTTTPPAPIPPELMAVMDSTKDEFFRDLQVTLDEEDFKTLEQGQFSGELELAVESQLKHFQDQMIATAADELAALGNRGITVRTFPSVSGQDAEVVLLGPNQVALPGELTPQNGPQTVANVLDLERVRAQVDKSGSSLPETFSEADKRSVLHLVKRIIRPNLTFKPAETTLRQQHARTAVAPVVIQLKRGDKVISAGEHIDRHHAVIFDGMRAQSAQIDPRQVRSGSGLLAALMILVVFGFGRGLRRFRPTRKDVLLLAGILLAMLALTDASLVIAESMRDRLPKLGADALTYAVPFAAGTMLVRFVLGSEEALLFSGVFALLAAILAGDSLTLGLYAWVGSLIAAQRVVGAKDRGALFRAGLATGICNVLTVVCLQLISGKLFSMETAEAALAGLVGGAVFVPVLVMGAAPLVEWLGGYVTDIKLLELANLNHPALKELIVQAPGTYHHSIIMGSLVEEAATAIGANPLLARVCAYYHDIGKGKNPLYFGENQKGENRHDKLAPQMSAMIIKRHVTDGLEMAKQYKLPKAVSDAIPQHHGTKLVGYFFHKAMKENEGKENAPPLDESLYRYPGPKPQFREAALVMIADAVEAASRALPEPTDANLQALVKKMINSIFADGQLDECDLTLKDLNVLARAFYQTLRGIYHTRPEYPPGAVQPPPRPEGPSPTLRAVGEPDPSPGTGPGKGDVKKLGT
jgi:putative nucleotidyltransferase with HDIG domain